MNCDLHRSAATLELWPLICCCFPFPSFPLFLFLAVQSETSDWNSIDITNMMAETVPNLSDQFIPGLSGGELYLFPASLASLPSSSSCFHWLLEEIQDAE